MSTKKQSSSNVSSLPEEGRFEGAADSNKHVSRRDNDIGSDISVAPGNKILKDASVDGLFQLDSVIEDASGASYSATAAVVQDIAALSPNPNHPQLMNRSRFNRRQKIIGALGVAWLLICGGLWYESSSSLPIYVYNANRAVALENAEERVITAGDRLPYNVQIRTETVGLLSLKVQGQHLLFSERTVARIKFEALRSDRVLIELDRGRLSVRRLGVQHPGYITVITKAARFEGIDADFTIEASSTRTLAEVESGTVMLQRIASNKKELLESGSQIEVSN